MLLSSRSEKRGVLYVLKRGATKKSGESVPSRRVAANIGPYFVVVLDSGAATTFGLRLI
jgi:hypothetical protein